MLLAISIVLPSALNAMGGSSSSTITSGKVIGSYYHSGHALERMVQRGANALDVAWVISHGNRYNAFDRSKPLVCSRQLCVDTGKKLGVIIDRDTNDVITVLRGMDKQRLDAWIKQHTPTKEERIVLAKSHAADIKQLQPKKRSHKSDELCPSDDFYLK